MFERGFYCSTYHSGACPCLCEAEVEAVDESGAGFFRGLIIGVAINAVAFAWLALGYVAVSKFFGG